MTVSLLILGAVAPLVVRAGGGCHAGGDGSVYTEGPATVIRMDTCSFAPTVVRVPEGTTIRFLNTATVQHQVIGRANSWGTVLLEPGDERSVRFDDAGTFPYMCPLHPGMIGAVVVGSGEGAAGPPEPVADPTASAVAAEGAPASAQVSTDLVAPVALAGLAGVVIGLLAARVRPRTTR
ncbi:MAG TPA: plastocyanin/azurin family copper-binding protein [Candidatus Limnocylindrales bacterium]|nr:plastocyanin/azurin family copper-binding protein [Candidatus Limnocylindrales bacterium]